MLKYKSISATVGDKRNRTCGRASWLGQGGPAKWGPENSPVPTIQFQQAYCLGETWDPQMIRLASSIEGYETRQSVKLVLRAEDLAYWDSDKDRFVVEADKIELQVGSSSRDIKLTSTISIVD